MKAKFLWIYDMKIDKFAMSFFFKKEKEKLYHKRKENYIKLFLNRNITFDKTFQN